MPRAGAYLPVLATAAACLAASAPWRAVSALDSDRTAPDYTRTAPDSDRTVPDSDRITPDYIRTAPDSDRTVPDSDRITPDYIRTAPDVRAWPDADGLILRQHVRIALHADGRVTRHEETAVKMLQEWTARSGQFDPRLDWNDRRASLRVDLARTYRKDGTAVDAGPNSFVPNTAHPLEWAVPFAHMRQMVVSHVGVEHGSTSILAATIADRAPSGVPLWGVIPLQGMLPVLDHQVLFEVPEGTPFSWRAVACALQPEIATSGGVTSYTFRRRNVPAANLAEQPSGQAGLQRLAYSTARDWAEARGWLSRKLEVLPREEPLKRRAEEIVEGSLLDLERLGRIHGFVVDGVRTVSWPLDAFDYEIRPPAEVLRSSVGHPLEKAVLLASLLKEAGFDAVVALAAGERGDAGEVPCLPWLDRAWVRVRRGGQEVWLDPTATAEKASAGHLAGRAVLVLEGWAEAPRRRGELDAATNRAALRVELSASASGRELALSGTADLDLGGLYNPAVSFDRKGDRLRGVATGIASQFGGAGAKEVVVGQKSAELTALRVAFEGGRLEPSEAGLFRLVLPRIPGALEGQTFQTHRERRTLPLVLPAPAVERTELVLDLQENVEAVFLPPEVALDGPGGSASRSVTREGRKVTIRCALAFTSADIPPEAYPRLRAMFAAFEGASARTLLLRLR